MQYLHRAGNDEWRRTTEGPTPCRSSRQVKHKSRHTDGRMSGRRDMHTFSDGREGEKLRVGAKREPSSAFFVESSSAAYAIGRIGSPASSSGLRRTNIPDSNSHWTTATSYVSFPSSEDTTEDLQREASRPARCEAAGPR